MTVEDLDDLHPLLDAHGQVFDVGVGVHLETVLLGDLPDALSSRGPVQEEASPHRLDAQHHVLRHRHHRDEHEVLVDHPDALGDGIAGLVDLHPPASDVDLPLVGRVEAVEDVHQGRLPGTVLTQQGVDLSLLQGEVNVVVGQDAGKGFGDAS